MSFRTVSARGLCLAVVLLCGGNAARAGAAAAGAEVAPGFSAETLARVDRPFQGEVIALSPDGKRIAYTTYDKGRLSLVVSDMERKVNRVGMLLEDTKTSLPPSQLKRLKWLSNHRLLIETVEGDLFTCDENGLNAVRLWPKNDDGLVNTMEIDRALNIQNAPTRLIGRVPDSPESVLIETAATIGAERFANLYRVDTVAGVAELANRELYLPHQVALYGRGDMLMWPPEPPVDPSEFTMPSPSAVRAAAAAAEGFVGAEAPRADMPTREQQRAQAHPTLEPERGGPVSRDSSSTGRMLYDRNGKPRILYSTAVSSADRPFLVTQGRDVFVPNIAPQTLDKWLGQPDRREFVVSAANYFGERSFPVAFDYDPDVMYYASNVGRDTYGIFRLNMLTKAREEVFTRIPFDLAGLEPDFPESNLVFDDRTRKLLGIRVTALRPQTAWIDADFAAMQADLARAFPRHTAEIVDWDDTRSKLLVRVTAEDDPGSYFLFDTREPRLDYFVSRAPWLKTSDVRESTSFAFDSPSGARLTGYLSLPNNPKINPPPLVIYLQGGLWDRADPVYNREAQMLANMGLVVIRLNFRGTAGFGRKHLLAISEGLDSIPLEDMMATVDWIAGKYRVDRRKVVVMGEGFGGYLALRAMQLRPDVFKAAISLNAPTNLTAWAATRPIKAAPMYKNGSTESGIEVDFVSYVRAAFIRNSKKGNEQPAVEGEFRKPVLVIENPASTDVTPTATFLGRLGLGMRGARVERLSIKGPFEGGSEDTRKRVFTKIEEFLNDDVYEFNTSIQNMRPVENQNTPQMRGMGGRGMR